MRAKTIILPAFVAAGAFVAMGAAQADMFTIGGQPERTAQDAYAHLADPDMTLEQEIAAERSADEAAANMGEVWLEADGDAQPAPSVF